jgi:hypothetical protein
MSRSSADEFDQRGLLINGYDYINQAWVIGGKYADCGHPKNLRCGCYGREHADEPSACWRCDNDRHYQHTAQNGHHPDCDNQEEAEYNFMCGQHCPLVTKVARESLL